MDVDDPRDYHCLHVPDHIGVVNVAIVFLIQGLVTASTELVTGTRDKPWESGKKIRETLLGVSLQGPQSAAPGADKNV